jgi:hypothetical protein
LEEWILTRRGVKERSQCSEEVEANEVAERWIQEGEREIGLEVVWVEEIPVEDAREESAIRVGNKKILEEVSGETEPSKHEVEGESQTSPTKEHAKRHHLFLPSEGDLSISTVCLPDELGTSPSIDPSLISAVKAVPRACTSRRGQKATQVESEAWREGNASEVCRERSLRSKKEEREEVEK